MRIENSEKRIERMRDFAWGEFLPGFTGILFSAYGIVWMSVLMLVVIIWTYFINRSAGADSKWEFRTYLFLFVAIPLLLLNGIFEFVPPLFLLFPAMTAFLLIDIVWWDDLFNRKSSDMPSDS